MARGICDSYFDRLSARPIPPGLVFCSVARRKPGVRLGLEPPLVRFRLIRLQFRPDVFAHIHIGNVNRQNFKRRPRIQPFVSNT